MKHDCLNCPTTKLIRTSSYGNLLICNNPESNEYRNQVGKNIRCKKIKEKER